MLSTFLKTVVILLLAAHACKKCVKRRGLLCRQVRNLFPRLPASASVRIIAASSHWSGSRSRDPATAQARRLNAVQDFPMGAAVRERGGGNRLCVSPNEYIPPLPSPSSLSPSSAL